MAGHDAGSSTGTTGARVTGSNTGVGRTLNYNLGNDILNRVKAANLATAKSTLATKTGAQAAMLGKIAVRGIDMVGTSMQEGAAKTKELLNLFKEAEQRDGWATADYYASYKDFENQRREFYEQAVRTGGPVNIAAEGEEPILKTADELLAEQTEDAKALQNQVSIGNDINTAWSAGSLVQYDPSKSAEDNIISENDFEYLSLYNNNKGTIPLKGDDGKSRVGIDMHDTTIGGRAGSSYIKNGEIDFAQLSAAVGEEAAKAFSIETIGDEPRLVRSHTAAEVNDILQGAMKPNQLSNALQETFDTMVTDASKNPADFQVKFDENDLSTKFGNFITDYSMVKKAALAEVAGRTFADDFMSHPDFGKFGVDAASGNLIYSSNSGLATYDKDGVTGLSSAELAAIPEADKKKVLQEMMKEENIDIYRAYWGEWAMLRAKGKVNNVYDATGTKAVTSINVTAPISNNAGLTGNVL